MLEAKNLTQTFGAHTALENLSITIAPGETFCFLGANGAGKTTTINLFLGFLEPSSGTAVVTQRALYRVAEADSAASRMFITAAADRLTALSEAVGPAIISRNRVTLDEYAAMPGFSFSGRSEAERGQLVWPAVAFLFLIALALAVLAARRRSGTPL